MMTKYYFREIDNIYENYKFIEYKKVLLSNNLLKRFNIAVNALWSQLGEMGREEPWKTLLSPLFDYLRFAATTPLPFNHSFLNGPSGSLLGQDSTRISALKLSYPTAGGAYQELLQLLNSLQLHEECPILDWLLSTGFLDSEGVKEKDVTGHTRKNGLVLASTRAADLTELFYRELGVSNGPLVLAPGSLKDLGNFGELVFLGPPAWFPAHILQSLRTTKLIFVYYEWIRDSDRHLPRFEGALAEQNIHWSVEHYGHEPDHRIQSISAHEGIDAGSYLPEIDWSAIQAGLLSHERDGATEMVPARLFILEGSRAVYLADSENSKILTINHELKKYGDIVDYSKMADLVPNEYIILRTYSDSHPIEIIANVLLKKTANGLRSLQKNWKYPLREAVECSSLEKVADKLREMGSRIANEANVQNWMCDRNICTAEYTDFAAIMKFGGREGETARYWKAMKVIDRAHKMAGQRIRKLLLEEIQRTDLSPLRRNGTVEIRIPGLPEAGSMTAYRIIGIAPESVRIPLGRIEVPFILE